jgi:hypothetical protein
MTRNVRKPNEVRVGGALALGGLVLLLGSALVARSGTVGGPERRVFHAVNDLPDWLYQPPVDLPAVRQPRRRLPPGCRGGSRPP